MIVVVIVNRWVGKIVLLHFYCILISESQKVVVKKSAAVFTIADSVSVRVMFIDCFHEDYPLMYFFFDKVDKRMAIIIVFIDHVPP